MKTFSLLVVILTSFYNSIAQPPKTDSIAKIEISRLAFITGKWAGNGWMIGPGNKKYTFSQTENVQFKLDSTALLIEGMGKSNGMVIHNALAMMRYNNTEKNYSFNSYLSTGRQGNYKAELKENRLYWYPNENMRYIIYLNDKGQWYETGENKKDGNWVQFFEMTLDKQKD